MRSSPLSKFPASLLPADELGIHLHHCIRCSKEDESNQSSVRAARGGNSEVQHLLKRPFGWCSWRHLNGESMGVFEDTQRRAILIDGLLSLHPVTRPPTAGPQDERRLTIGKQTTSGISTNAFRCFTTADLPKLVAVGEESREVLTSNSGRHIPKLVATLERHL